MFIHGLRVNFILHHKKNTHVVARLAFSGRVPVYVSLCQGCLFCAGNLRRHPRRTRPTLLPFAFPFPRQPISFISTSILA
jgi:hypothetical protein